MRCHVAARLVVAAGLVGALAPAGVSPGQDALGTGRALDSNLRVGSDGRNAPGRDVMREIRLRNAIVVGRAPGGLSFRGDVGYGAENDFRGTLAEDDLFAFERDAILSGVTGRGVRGVEALQFQMQLTVGGLVGEGDVLPDPYVRRFMDASSVDSLRNEGALGPPSRGRDPLEYRPGTLRSTSEFTTRRSDSPTLLRVIQGEEEQTAPLFEVASPLRSITTDEEIRTERRLSDLLQVIERVESRVESDVATEAESSRLEPEAVERRPGAYQSIVERLAERQELRLEPEPDAEETTEDAEAPAPRAEGDRPAEPLANEPSLLTELRELREELMRPQEAASDEGDAGDGEDADAIEETRRRVLETARAIFGGEPIEVETLAPGADERVDLYGIHMQRGQAQLASGEWFAAEERFTSALGLRPGDPMAAVGRVHAQIGGGMFLSAGLNLQKLFRSHPELIKVRYDERLLPFGQRLDEITALLRARLRGADDFSHGAALVKAYLGFQTGDAEWVREGLDRMVEIDEERSLEPSPLAAVLREAWIGRR